MDVKGGDEVKEFYDEFIKMIKIFNLKVEIGEFGVYMKVEINNDGFVIILLDSKRNF